jgi:hypothetical protein
MWQMRHRFSSNVAGTRQGGSDKPDGQFGRSALTASTPTPPASGAGSTAHRVGPAHPPPAYRKLLARLDARFPQAGPCAFCGGSDKRHRLWDALDGGARADGIESTARWMDVSVDDVRLVVEAFAFARQRHLKLPGRFPLVT